MSAITEATMVIYSRLPVALFYQQQNLKCECKMVQMIISASCSNQATGAINRTRVIIGPGIYVESLPSAPTYATYVEPVVEKEARSIQNDPRDQPR
jgi:hypothetical protein